LPGRRPERSRTAGTGRCRCHDCRRFRAWWTPAKIEAWKRKHGVALVRTKTARARPSDAEIAELLASAKRWKPISVAPTSNGEWKDLSRPSAGGPMPRSGPLARAWSGGQCLQACVASLLNTTPERVPDPGGSYKAEPRDWHGHYNDLLTKATGHRLEFLPPSLCPPRNPNQLWIAGIHEHGDRDGHAVLARAHFVIHDPADIYTGRPVPMDRLTDGMLVTPTRRIVPMFSPRGSGRVVVAA
jgi:hypothetical protein